MTLPKKTCPVLGASWPPAGRFSDKCISSLVYTDDSGTRPQSENSTNQLAAPTENEHNWFWNHIISGSPAAEYTNYKMQNFAGGDNPNHACAKYKNAEFKMKHAG